MAENGAKMQREEALRAIFAGIDDGMRSVIDPMITETAYLERELATLRALPKIRVNPSDPTQQKSTPAAKLYKEFLQQYTNNIKVLVLVLRREAPEQESPLREFFNMKKEREQHGRA